MAMINHSPENASHQISQATVGGKYTNKGLAYRYYKMTGGPSVAGRVYVHTSVRGEVEESNAVTDQAAGVAVGIIEADEYGYFAVDGILNMPVLDATGGPNTPLGVGAGGLPVLASATTVVGSFVGSKLNEGVAEDGLPVVNRADVMLVIS